MAETSIPPMPCRVMGDDGGGRPWRSRQNGQPAGGGAVYGLGMIGAMMYFLGSARSGWDYVLAIPKASVWPALLVYKLLKSFYG